MNYYAKSLIFDTKYFNLKGAILTLKFDNGLKQLMPFFYTFLNLMKVGKK